MMVFKRSACSGTYHNVPTIAYIAHSQRYLMVFKKKTPFAWCEKHLPSNEQWVICPRLNLCQLEGETPTTLSAKGIGRLVKGIREHYQIPRGVYANMECSPDTITPEKVAAAHEAGITRLSMGVQTFNNEILERCERGHTGELAEKACKTLLQQNFQDLNVDLMRGLPGQTPEIFADDIEKFIETKIPSLHLYRLRLPPKHPLLRSEPYTRNYVRDVLAMQIIADRSLSA